MNVQTTERPSAAGAPAAAAKGDAAASVKDLIYRATIMLDDQQWNDWLALCADDFVYQIRSWSPEINKDMTYMHAKRTDMQHLIDLLPKHNTDHSPLTRHTTVYTVDVAEDGKSAKAISAFIVHQHMLDTGSNSHVSAGESHLFLVGKYHDEFVIEDGTPRFKARTVRLQERRLDRGSHWPI
ncbi:Ring hydroxylating beta subunit [Methyloligella halotolerans]|uniref:Ring hydroxylating beta subunit n=1 Tax=Methyloligella halotolerans TaxID=1177755 RepID=A0A1E2RUX3_9HYPH|nr:aromatic-ring-hydroxylating dioxygenase subunit beta [Methyloligella halotolerans]ODA65898.1 Ring hydroxylating beta subunit [Methyloligella halotolerans]